MWNEMGFAAGSHEVSEAAQNVGKERVFQEGPKTITKLSSEIFVPQIPVSVPIYACPPSMPFSKVRI